MQIPTYMMSDSCSISNFLGQTPSGPIYSDAKDFICRFEKHRKRYVNRKGEEYISKSKLFLHKTSDTEALVEGAKVVCNNEEMIVEDIIGQNSIMISYIECILK